MRYTLKLKQKGEMPYGQPSWLINFDERKDTPNVKKDSFSHKLCISVKTYKQTSTCVETGESCSWTTRTYCQLTLLTFVCRVRCRKYIRIHSWTKPFPIRDVKIKIGVQANSLSEVADIANYFDERLPGEFFDHYKWLLLRDGKPII